MEFPGGSGRPPPLPPGTPLPLARQGSFYSLTFDELQSAFGGAGKDFGSMNMDELLRNIWTAEESHAMADAAAASEPVDPQQPIQRQGSYTLPRTIIQKTVDEVWRDVIGFGTSAASGVPAAAPAKRQPTLGEVTLEEFLVRAGVVREDIAPTTQPAPQPPPPQPQPQQALFPQGNLFAPMVPPLSLGNGMVGGVVGQGGGGGITVASPRPISSNGLGVAVVSPRPIVSNGLGKMDGGDSSSLLPVPYVFNGGLRGRKGSAVEKVAERRQRRMIKNRESAARSRARKQAYMTELEEEVAKLKELNDELHRKQVEMLEKQKNEVLERINQLGPKAKRFCLRRTLTGPW